MLSDTFFAYYLQLNEKCFIIKIEMQLVELKSAFLTIK